MNDQELYRYAKTIIPGGTGLLSKRPEMFAPEVFPAYFKKARGCRLTTIDNRELIDFSTCGIGACLLGFNDEDVSSAVIKTVTDGSFSTLNPPEEVELAERLCAIHPWASWARFARTGGEICAVAIRIARACTRRSKVLIIGYHGWHDWYLAANLGNPDALGGLWLQGLSPHGVPSELSGTAIPCMHGDCEQLADLFKQHGSELAAVILEPCRHEEVAPEFLQLLRSSCTKYGALLVCDEITIGWRYCFGGSHLNLALEPDLAIYSKALGNGHPIAAVLGRKEFFDGAASAFLSSTYWTERTGPVAALVTLQKMQQTNTASYVNNIGKQVMELWKTTAEKSALPIKLTSEFGCLATFAFDSCHANIMRTLFTIKMLERNFIAGTAFYPTMAHSSKELMLYGAALREVFAELAALHAAGSDAIKNALHTPEAHCTFARLVK
ncbi:MAG: aminotransferase class III-fold pyridoxal phosphate-dependent enzyme [Lentisphaerae bacterium]|nr:aminotransferase class III-fold pyridoxal phosphate-dependent enzyme [Lentisphaerota bacterium]